MSPIDLERLFGTKPRSVEQSASVAAARIEPLIDESPRDHPVAPPRSTPADATLLSEVIAASYEPTLWGPDGWPADTVVKPLACPRCDSRDFWLPMVGPSTTRFPEPWRPQQSEWRCAACDPPKTANRIRAAAARLARQTEIQKRATMPQPAAPVMPDGFGSNLARYREQNVQKT